MTTTQDLMDAHDNWRCDMRPEARCRICLLIEEDGRYGQGDVAEACRLALDGDESCLQLVADWLREAEIAREANA